MMQRSRVILHVQDGDFRFASRVLKQARSALRSGFASRVELLGLFDDDLPVVDETEDGLRIHRTVHAPTGRRKGWVPALWRLWRRWMRFYRAGKSLPCDLVHCHSVGALVPSVLLGRYHSVPVVYDAHELESQAGQPRAASLLALIIESVLIRRVDVVVCVSDAIADWYARRFSIVRPMVVRNVPDIRSQVDLVGPHPLRARCGLGAEDLVFLYQGALSPGRRVEQLLRVFAKAAADRHVVFMGYGVLQPEIEEAARRHRNIHFVSAVPPEQVLAHTKDANVGICGGENICLSYFVSLPNKLFEYLHAGLPLLVPQWPEMSRIVDSYGCGWTIGEADDEWLEAIVGLTRDSIATAAMGARRAAAQFSWEAEVQVLEQGYLRALGRAGGQ